MNGTGGVNIAPISSQHKYTTDVINDHDVIGSFTGREHLFDCCDW